MWSVVRVRASGADGCSGGPLKFLHSEGNEGSIVI